MIGRRGELAVGAPRHSPKLSQLIAAELAGPLHCDSSPLPVSHCPFPRHSRTNCHQRAAITTAPLSRVFPEPDCAPTALRRTHRTPQAPTASELASGLPACWHGRANEHPNAPEHPGAGINTTLSVARAACTESDPRCDHGDHIPSDAAGRARPGSAHCPPHRRSGQVQSDDVRRVQHRIRGHPPEYRRARARRLHTSSERAPLGGFQCHIPAVLGYRR